MEMAKPQRFGVVVGDSVTNHLDTLKEKKVDNKSTWETTFKIAKPGDYVFFLDPQPYWEPAEDKFIVHVTKVIVDALGAEEGWERPIAELAESRQKSCPRRGPTACTRGTSFPASVQGRQAGSRCRGGSGMVGKRSHKSPD